MPTIAGLIVDDLSGIEDVAAFRHLNQLWIAELFAIEEEDGLQLSDPVGRIIAPGGAVLMARRDGESVGCVGLTPSRPGVLELVKMAVSPAHRGHGIGRVLVTAAIDRARSLGANRVELESNSRLAAAVHLYESCGFRHLGPDEHVPGPYIRADVAMALQLH